MLTAYAICAFIYLLLPIAVVIAFSFNDPAGRFNYTWQGFTLDNWINWNAVPGLADSMVLSIEIAAICEHRGDGSRNPDRAGARPSPLPGRGATNLLVFVPMATPEIVLGAALLTLFLQLKVPTGFLTIAIAHIMFIISYAVVTVKARLISFDRHLEEAAMDLGADEWTTFRKVTLPLIAPAILSALLLGFALSIDDFVITYFNPGAETTFPLFVWGAARVGAPPQVNVLGDRDLRARVHHRRHQRPSSRTAEGRDDRMTARPPAGRERPPLAALHPHGWLPRRGDPGDRQRRRLLSRPTRTASAISTRSRASSRSTSATASARRSARRRSRRCGSCPSTPTGRTPIRARSSWRASSPRSRPAT